MLSIGLCILIDFYNIKKQVSVVKVSMLSWMVDINPLNKYNFLAANNPSP